MSLRSFSLLSLLLVSLAENVNETSSWRTAFIYCHCGLSCAKQLESWYILDLGTNCGCMACVEENTTSPTNPALRGSDQGQDGQVLPVDNEEPQTSETSEKLKSLNMASPEAWEAASVGSKVLYCRCGYGCAYGRQLGMTTYYCFRYGCRPCPH